MILVTCNYCGKEIKQSHWYMQFTSGNSRKKQHMCKKCFQKAERLLGENKK